MDGTGRRLVATAAGISSSGRGAKLFAKGRDRGKPACMWKDLKQTWRRLEAGKPGRRFEEEFRRRHGASRSPLQRALLIGGGLVFMAAGFLLLFMPGPGLLVLFVGGFLLAQQSLPAAQAIDWIEVRLRKLLAWSLRLRRRSSPTLKVMLVVLAVVVLGAMGFGVFKFLESSGLT